MIARVVRWGLGYMGQFNDLKQALRASRRSHSRTVRCVVAVITAGYRVGRMFVDGQHRYLVLLKLFNRQRLHQTTPLTWMDRYPEIFSTCRHYFAERDDLKILSYGCSTGEEVLTLRRYFPSAFICGSEINRRSLAVCRKRKVDNRIVFIQSDPATIARYGPFDAIFCMAVLQRTPEAVAEQGIINLNPIYPFERFNRQIGEFDTFLAKDGLLVIRHTQYRFQDTAVVSKYVPLTLEHGFEVGSKFDRTSHRLSDAETRGLRSIFVKISQRDASKDGVNMRDRLLP